jgi:ubiquitin-protein ligase
MALPLPGSTPDGDATMVHTFFELLSKACLFRHINPRSSAGGDSQQPGVKDGRDSDPACTTATPPAVGGQSGTHHHLDLEDVVVWMTDSDRRHERTTAVIRCCLEFFILYLSAPQTHECSASRLTADDILCTCLLPLLEENLAVGIEDMETEASLFRHTISLIYQLTQLGDDSAKVLGPIGRQWKPAQRRSVMHLCEDVDKLVAEYLDGMRHTESADGGLNTHGESFFEMVRFVAACVRQLCADLQTTEEEASRDASNETPQLARHGEIGAWRCLPSVVTWLPGEVIPVSGAVLDEEYEQGMAGHKLEGLEGVRDSHYWKSYGTMRVMPTRMARKVMQELVALRRDLPLNRREGVILRYDEERADFIKILIFGSEDTPYAAGCFEYHIYCPPTYPDVAPSVWLMTTGNGRVRFNPNLYEDGLVCSSLLNQGSGWGHVT